MIARIDVTIDCRDLAKVAGFWTALLGYDRCQVLDDRYWAATHPHAAGPRLVFQLVPDPAPDHKSMIHKSAIHKSTIHKSTIHKSTIHIDVHVDDVEQAVQRAITLGGTRVDAEPIVEAGSSWVRCLDPEGNVLCLVQPA
jgi:catechol 2,3-dioxygenase-like lactoylglutathione lyase family enzyme